MNVTVICDVLGVANNGTTIATLNLVRYLKKQGHKVTIVANDFGSEDLTENEKKKMPSLSLGKLADKVLANNGVSLATPDKKILEESIQSADVVHIQLPFLIGTNAAKIAKELDKPLTASFHCQAENVSSHFFLVNNMNVSEVIYNTFYKSLYQYVDCVHYPTKFIRDVFEESCGHKTNGYVISNGVNASYVNKHYEKHNEKFSIVCCGRYSTEKAQHLLIEATAKCKHKDDIKLFFAGEGPLESKYRKLAEKNGVDADFSFYTRKDLIELLNTADLYVHTAFIEIEAIACIEAICCGLVPIINNAARSATKSFAMDFNNLFNENDTNDLAAKLDFWYEHPEMRLEYAKKYESMAGQFNQEDCMKRMEQMLQDAIEMHKK